MIEVTPAAIERLAKAIGVELRPGWADEDGRKVVDAAAAGNFDALVGEVEAVYQRGKRRDLSTIVGVEVTLVLPLSSKDSLALISRLASAGLEQAKVKVRL